AMFRLAIVTDGEAGDAAIASGAERAAARSGNPSVRHAAHATMKIVRVRARAMVLVSCGKAVLMRRHISVLAGWAFCLVSLLFQTSSAAQTPAGTPASGPSRPVLVEG